MIKIILSPRSFIVFALSLNLVFCLFCNLKAIAGTGQIFSPSGLPQSSTQNYTAPNPGNTPTVNFSTPPLPLGENVLQGFPAASVPLHNNNSSTPAQNQPPIIPETNSVESFFQIPPTTIQIEKSQMNKKQSPRKSSSKLIWHILDNLGVPMIVDKDNDLDPQLKQTYTMSPPKPINHISPPSAPQKIPESELEGTDVTPQSDNQPVQLH